MSYKVALVADNHFIQEGNNYYVNGTYTKQYLKRFTTNFDELIVIARVKEATETDKLEKLRESGGERVSFCKLKDFYGIRNYLINKNKIKKQIKDCLKNVDAIFVRMPCILTTITISCAKELNIPFMLDVGADPNTIYRSAKPTLFEILISRYMMKKCKKNCMMANGVSYVTQQILQNKYPCKAIINGESLKYFTASISNVDLSEDFFFDKRKYRKSDTIKLLHISNNILANSGKGHIECIYVLERLIKQGCKAEITFVGDNKNNNELIELGKKLNIENYIHFTGRIANREEYRNIILNHDIFLFPSHSEGLPRVLIEVMATGMVCVASNVDGIPELLQSQDIFDYSDIDGMSNRIFDINSNIEEMNNISKRNYDISLKYSNENLKEIYDEYYGKVRKLIDSKG